MRSLRPLVATEWPGHPSPRSLGVDEIAARDSDGTLSRQWAFDGLDMVFSHATPVSDRVHVRGSEAIR